MDQENAIVKFDVPELQLLDVSKAEQIRATFIPMADMLAAFEDEYNTVITESQKGITKELVAHARRLRLGISKVRIETEKARKIQKEDYIKAGKAIDAVSNILKWAVSGKEENLSKIENHFEIMEARRLEALQEERAAALLPYLPDANERKLSDMEPDVWEAYFQSKKKAWEDEREAEREAERQRQEKERMDALHHTRRELLLPYIQFWGPELTDTHLGYLEESDFRSKLVELVKLKEDYDVEQERLRVENERLREEARVAELKRKEQEEKERKARAAELKKQQKESEAKMAAEAIKAKEEKERREKAEAELRAREEADRKKKEEEEARAQAELSRDDSAKITSLIEDLQKIKGRFNFKSRKNQHMFAGVCGMIDNVIEYVNIKKA